MNQSDNSTLTVVAPFVYQHWLNEYNGVEWLRVKQKLKFVRNENILSHRTPNGNDQKK